MTCSLLRMAVVGETALSLVGPPPAFADTPNDLRDLIGIRGSSADGEMLRRGYSLAKSTDDASYWWNSDRRSCASVEIDDVRVSGINVETARQCGKGGSNGAAAAAVGALLVGALVAGAAASDKHKRHDDDDDGGGSDRAIGAGSCSARRTASTATRANRPATTTAASRPTGRAVSSDPVRRRRSTMIALRPITFFTAVTLIPVAIPAVGQNAARYESARQIVAEKLGADFTQKQVAALDVAAHATAVSVLCDRLDLDEGALRSRLQAAIAESTRATSASIARDGLRDRMLVGFGALLGLMLEEAAPNNPRFCSAAETDMRKQGATSPLRPHVAR